MKTINKFLLEKLIINKNTKEKTWQSKLIYKVETIFSYNKAYTNKFSQIINDFLNTDKYKKCEGEYCIIASDFYKDHFFNYYDGKDCVANFLNDIEYTELSEIFDDNQFEYSYSNTKKYKNDKYDIDLYIESGIIAINGSKNGYSDEDSYVSIILVPKIDAHIPKEVSEKLVITKNTKEKKYNTPYPSELVKVPVCDFENQIAYKNDVWKELELPITTYVIFKDKYRGDRPHFQFTYDFVMGLCAYEDDYEDFDPTKDILYASDDLKEILEWYFNYLGINEYPTINNYHDWFDKYEYNFMGKKSIDNCYIMAEIYCGKDKYYNHPDFKNLNYEIDLEKILKTFFDIE